MHRGLGVFLRVTIQRPPFSVLLGQGRVCGRLGLEQLGLKSPDTYGVLPFCLTVFNLTS